MSDDQENIIDFAEALLNRSPQDLLPLRDETPTSNRFEGCQHYKVALDDEARTVTCRDCEKELDAFWYLKLLAREWKHRAYADERVLEAKREIEQARLNAQVRGHYFERPKDGARAEAWDGFTEAIGEPPLSMWRSGGQWMARLQSDSSAIYSLEYAQMLAAQRRREEKS